MLLALASAWLTAATTRSCSMPISLGSTTVASIFSSTSSSLPVTTATTMPPPADASTRFCARSSCALARSFCIRCAASRRPESMSSLPIDFDLLDRGAERLDDRLGDGVLARLVLARLLRLALALGLHVGERRGGRLDGLRLHIDGMPGRGERALEGPDVLDVEA